MNIRKFFSEEQKARIMQAIGEAEKETSGEIRVHLETVCRGNALDQAGKIFRKLKMHRTEQRNGALVYLAVKDKKFAIFGDEGIDEKVPDDFWEDVKDQMREKFAAGEFTEGIVLGIEQIGQKLKEYFPYQTDDRNELSDDISIG